MEKSYEYLIKILMVGESGVGKSCVIRRFVRNEFTLNHLSTIAIDFKLQKMEIDEKMIMI